MKQLFSILLSFTILIQSFGLSINDLTQIDDFIEHAMMHNQKYGDSLLTFISKHYGELKAEHHEEHQEEKHEHEQLPFDHNTCVNTHIPLFLSSNKQDFKPLYFHDSKAPIFFYKASLTSRHSIDIYHPPRVA